MKDETQDRMKNTGDQFRQVSGLPERESDEPHNPAEPSELRRFAEPEGGYGGEGETEEDARAGQVDEELVEELQRGEELSAKSGQGATDGVDASTSTEATEAQADEAEKAAKKAAKKSTAKKES